MGLGQRVVPTLAVALRQRAVIVRHFQAPRISDYLRITVGTDGQTDRLLSTLSDIFKHTEGGARREKPYSIN